MTRTLPHDTYIEAVLGALGAAGLEVADAWTSDAETRGVYCYLDAVITLDPDTTGLDKERWPNGLILIWEWHTGIEQGEPERGPSWEWAELRGNHGGNEQPEPLTAEGYAAPEYVAECVRAVIEKRNASVPAARWENADVLNAACETWGSDEDDSDGSDSDA